VSRVLSQTRHVIGHFGDESFQAITCTWQLKTNKRICNKNTHKKQKNKLALGKKNTQ